MVASGLVNYNASALVLPARKRENVSSPLVPIGVSKCPTASIVNMDIRTAAPNASAPPRRSRPAKTLSDRGRSKCRQRTKCHAVLSAVHCSPCCPNRLVSVLSAALSCTRASSARTLILRVASSACNRFRKELPGRTRATSVSPLPSACVWKNRLPRVPRPQARMMRAKPLTVCSKIRYRIADPELWFLRWPQQHLAYKGLRLLRDQHFHYMAHIFRTQHLVGIFAGVRTEFSIN